MASRKYVRDGAGRFAGGGGGLAGTKVTYGKAGGFANAAFRGRVAANRKAGNLARGRRNKMLKRAALGVGTAAAFGALQMAGRKQTARLGAPSSEGRKRVRAMVKATRTLSN